MSEEREGMPWMPEDDLLIMIDEPAPARAGEAYEAIRGLRYAAVQVVVDHDAGRDIAAAVAELERALLAGIAEEQ